MVRRKLKSICILHRLSLSFPDGNEGSKEDKLSNACPVTCAYVFEALKKVGCQGKKIGSTTVWRESVKQIARKSEVPDQKDDFLG
jgi:hypothetical protein